MVKYVGNMHGNEAVGRELLLFFIEHILQTYQAASALGNQTMDDNSREIVQLIQTLDIHIMPTMNPDGFERFARQFMAEFSRLYLTIGTFFLLFQLVKRAYDWV